MHGHLSKCAYSQYSFDMQQVHSNREPISKVSTQGGENSSVIVRTDLSSLLSEYTNSQRRYNDRLESLEREMVSLKGQVSDSFVTTNEHELNRTFTTKKTPISQPTSARVKSPSRIPLPIAARRLSHEDKPIIPTNNILTSRPLPSVSVLRSKTFHNSTSQSLSNASEETNLLRSTKGQSDQRRHKDVSSSDSDIRIPNYSCLEDLIKANEQLFLDNDHLRSELNRLKTENIFLLRSIKTNAGNSEPILGTERIMAERERQELNMELARQVDENKRLRKSLLAQSAKFITLRQSITNPNASTSVSADYHSTRQSTPQSSPNSSRIPKSKSARFSSRPREVVRTNTFYHDPL